MGFRHYLFLAIAASMAACNSGIYLRDGVTDGDTFYLSQRALADDDPVLQSWVSYSLTRSACQLNIDSANPARANTFACELSAREDLLSTWREKKGFDTAVADEYLDSLVSVQDAGFLEEYVMHYFGRRQWKNPVGLELRAYRRWMSANLPRHDAETRLIGSWNYARIVTPN